ncbi:HAD family hydrolase [Motilimonas eburnea]|uniref:HAD family hydrolase n=1 Tax=Motilimonas eburnea TaxID=1737488 RepID=UPI001E53F29D|nr:HAD family hydrolase [Motilimonas eburnea]MCE2570961.1 HAD family hydrolase [Motilimonas eburnea]
MKQKLLILDLDETLIYATENKLNMGHSFIAGQYFVYKRPYLKEFLEYCLDEFLVAVWTSSNELYAAKIVNQIFGEDHDLEFVWSRERCVRKFDPEIYDWFYVKDLKKVKKKGYSLESMIMVDDTPKKLIRNYGNLVRVCEFVGDQRDEELLDLIIYLEELKRVENVRQVEKRNWKSRKV